MARLRPITLAHRAWVLIAGWPFLILAGLFGFGCIVLPFALLFPADPDGPYKPFAIPLLFLVGAGAIGFALALARGAVDEMTIHGCPDSRSGSQPADSLSNASAASILFRGVSFSGIGSLIAGAGLGCLARSALEFLLLGPPIVLSIPITIPLPQGGTVIGTTTSTVPPFATLREAVIYCLVGVALLAPLAWRMRSRQALARERMDAME